MVVEGSKPCNCDHPHMDEPGAGVAWSVAIGPGSWREQHLQPPNGKMVLEHHLSGGTICGWKTLTRWELWSEVSSTGCSSMRSERVDRSIDMKAQEPVPTRDTQSTPAARTLDSISPEVPGAGVALSPGLALPRVDWQRFATLPLQQIQRTVRVKLQHCNTTHTVL